MALGQGVLQTFVDVLLVDNGFQFEEATEDDHVEDLADAELLGFGGSGDLVDVDVFAGGLVGDAVGVIDEVTTGLHSALKLVQRLLVEDDGSVELVDDGRADALVADDDGDVGGAATHLGAVAGHPADLFVLHNSGVGKDFTHREDALSTETGYDDFFSHFL